MRRGCSRNEKASSAANTSRGRAEMNDGRPDPSEGSPLGQSPDGARSARKLDKREGPAADNSTAQKPARSRRRSSRTSSENAARQSFLFVDSTSSREKRAHVMRHHIQMKRSQNAMTEKPGQQTSSQDFRGFARQGEPDPVSPSTQSPAQASVRCSCSVIGVG